MSLAIKINITNLHELVPGCLHRRTRTEAFLQRPALLLDMACTLQPVTSSMAWAGL
jgi:hypothetical protein